MKSGVPANLARSKATWTNLAPPKEAPPWKVASSNEACLKSDRPG